MLTNCLRSSYTTFLRLCTVLLPHRATAYYYTRDSSQRFYLMLLPSAYISWNYAVVANPCRKLVQLSYVDTLATRITDLSNPLLLLSTTRVPASKLLEIKRCRPACWIICMFCKGPGWLWCCENLLGMAKSRDHTFPPSCFDIRRPLNAN